MKILETQLGQLSRQNAKRPPSTLPSDIVVNPREQCNAIYVDYSDSYEDKEIEEKVSTTLQIPSTAQAVSGYIVQQVEE